MSSLTAVQCTLHPGQDYETENLNSSGEMQGGHKNISMKNILIEATHELGVLIFKACPQ